MCYDLVVKTRAQHLLQVTLAATPSGERQTWPPVCSSFLHTQNSSLSVSASSQCCITSKPYLKIHYSISLTVALLLTSNSNSHFSEIQQRSFSKHLACSSQLKSHIITWSCESILLSRTARRVYWELHKNKKEWNHHWLSAYYVKAPMAYVISKFHQQLTSHVFKFHQQLS